MISLSMFTPDYRNIVNAAEDKASSRIPLYEHIISPLIMEAMQGEKFAELVGGNYSDKLEFFRHYCGFFMDSGYDAVSFECCTGEVMPGSGALGNHKEGVIKTRSDFDSYPWDAVPDMYFERNRDFFRALGETMPPGMKGIGGVGNGIFECVQDVVGFQELCYIKADDENLYTALFSKTGDMLVRIWERFLREFGDLYCVCRFGDDLGYKSNTLLSVEDIRKLIIPQYRRIVDLVHASGKPFLLHSCGCIFDVMDDIIFDAKIDAKHSNEDVIAPYSRWINEYGDRIGNFGGLDTDVLCDSSSVDVVSYTTNAYRLCEGKGRGVAIGSGNSIPDYVDPVRYRQMLDTVRRLRQD
jgi:uroporphyrinogen decarboxylase